MVGDIARVTAGQLAGLLEIARRDKLSKSQSEKLAAAFEQAGACIEPDVRVLGGSYSWHEKLSVFTIDEDVTAHGRSFPAAACVLQFGMAIALADGKAHDSELAHLAAHLDGAFHLSPLDRRRLDALRIAWMDRADDLLKLGKKMVERLGHEQRESLGRFLVVLAALEGQVGRDELATLRRAFRSLSLSPELLEQAIAECCPAADDGLAVVQQRTADTDAGEMIPPVASVKLDMNAVEALIRETKAVSAALAAAMSDDSGAPMGGADPATQPAPTMTAATPDADMSSAALPEPLAGLVSALRAKTEWTREDAEQLARQHGLMLNGAIEAINEWSIDALGTPVVDDFGDRLAVQG
jgi:tellurite resistance protein